MEGRGLRTVNVSLVQEYREDGKGLKTYLAYIGFYHVYWLLGGVNCDLLLSFIRRMSFM